MSEKITGIFSSSSLASLVFIQYPMGPVEDSPPDTYVATLPKGKSILFAFCDDLETPSFILLVVIKDSLGAKKLDRSFPT